MDLRTDIRGKCRIEATGGGRVDVFVHELVEWHDNGHVRTVGEHVGTFCLSRKWIADAVGADRIVVVWLFETRRGGLCARGKLMLDHRDEERRRTFQGVVASRYIL